MKKKRHHLFKVTKLSILQRNGKYSMVHINENSTLKGTDVIILTKCITLK